jgi:hypothetical protein
LVTWIVGHSATLKSAADAEGAVITERLETAKIKGIKDAMRRRALRMKAARCNAIPMYSFTHSAG